ncbi:MAG: efflux RND transporter periplasmic adaptor subunit [Alphaproteobacteria bacterium]
MLKTFLLVLTICFPFLGCEKSSQSPKSDPQSAEPNVTIHNITTENLTQDHEFTAQTQSYCTVQVRGRVEGILLKRHFQEGQIVQQGQVLFTIDPRPFEAKVQKARAFLAETKATDENAKKNHRRLQSLVKQKAVSQKEADEAEAAARVAEANVQSAEAQLKEAVLDLEYTTIASPLSGVTSIFQKNEGDLVIPGTGESSLLTQITQLDPIYVNFYVTDKELQESRNLFQKRSPEESPLAAKLFLSDGSPYSEAGVVTFSDPLMRKETGTFLMRATFPNPQHLLKPGQFVKLKIQSPPIPQAIVIPQRSVVQKDDQYLVFILDADLKVTPRVIQGKMLKDNLFWVKEGLSPGEKIILDGVIRLKPGMKVTIAPPSSTPPQEPKKS